MPQLDFFIFSHITIQATIGFLLVAGIIWNTGLIRIFKSIKTRYLYFKSLSNEMNNIVISHKKLTAKSYENVEIQKINESLVKRINNVINDK
jgi:hypothetical protein